jgi:nucleoside-diphosphate-sugar epimerase
MSRVLITGGAGMIGAAVARRLLADPAYDVRIADERNAPQWMREACEIRSADLRAPAQAQAAVKGCSQVIHVASFRAQDADLAAQAHTRIEYENALHNAVRWSASCTSLRRWYSNAPSCSRRPRSTCRDVPSRCRRAASAG